MKKTITITIGNMLFNVEEDAYLALSGYLDSLKAKFAGYADGSEIVSDIENRIAEHFSKGRDDQNKIVTLKDVDALIASMGTPEDFSEEPQPKTGEGTQNSTAETAQSGSSSSSTSETRGDRKLYRNPDDSLVAGVASGIAAYFGIETVIVRIIFLIFIIAHGAGLGIYLILWMVMPEAKTATEKLQMKGAPITLESVDSLMRDTAESLKTKKDRRKIFRAPIDFMSKVFGLVFKKVIPFIRKMIGVIISAAAGFALFVLTFVSVVTLFNVHSSYVDFPLRDAISGSLLYVTLLAGFVAASVPLMFILSFGKTIVRGRSEGRGRWGLGLLGVWFIALIALGVAATKIVPRYQDMLENNPNYRTVTQTFDAKDFSKIDVQNGIDVEIKEGSEFHVEADGRARDLARLAATSSDGTLLLARGQSGDHNICIFCIGGSVHVRVTAPNYESIHLSNGSDLDAESLTSKNLELDLQNGSQADIAMSSSTDHLAVSLRNGSHVSVTGGGVNTDLKLQNGSSIDARMFITENMTINAQNASHADVNVLKKLDVHAANGSLILYTGSPEIVKDLHNGSGLEPYPVDPALP
jgi:phage shock protein PspC (stress-responsive transcriptional regulator)